MFLPKLTYVVRFKFSPEHNHFILKVGLSDPHTLPYKMTAWRMHARDHYGFKSVELVAIGQPRAVRLLRKKFNRYLIDGCIENYERVDWYIAETQTGLEELEKIIKTVNLMESPPSYEFPMKVFTWSVVLSITAALLVSFGYQLGFKDGLYRKFNSLYLKGEIFPEFGSKPRQNTFR